MRLGRLTILALLTLTLAATGQFTRTEPAGPGPHRDGSRRLTFEQRLDAQRAIERVYHSHRLGTTRPFEKAVPRRLLERKVRTHLSQSVALETLWKSPISAGALRRELHRIAANTRFPERLRAIYEALDNDTYLIQETFVRAALADRLARGYFSGTPAGGPQQDWETWWEDARREFDPALAHEVAETLTLDAAPGGAGVVASPCELQDIWGAGETGVPPAPRSGHTAVWTGSEMIVWGGYDYSHGPPSEAFNTGALYDPVADSWTPTSLPAPPRPAAGTPRSGRGTG